MKTPTEQQVQKAILDYLHSKNYIAFKHRNVGIYVQRTNKYIPLSAGEKGISDVIGCDKDGRFIAIEVKKVGGKASPDQLKFLKRVNASGGIGILAYSIVDVVSKI